MKTFIGWFKRWKLKRRLKAIEKNKKKLEKMRSRELFSWDELIEYDLMEDD